MHYMFQSKQKAYHFFQQVSNHLKPGGELIAVTMDCRVIAEELLHDLHGVFDGFTDDGVLLPTASDDNDVDNDNDNDEVVKKEEEEDKDKDKGNNVHEDDDDGSNKDSNSCSNKSSNYKMMDTKSSSSSSSSSSNSSSSSRSRSSSSISYDEEEDAFRQIILSINRDNNKHVASTEKVLSFRNDLGYLILQIKFSNDMYHKLLRYHHHHHHYHYHQHTSRSSMIEESSRDLMKSANESSTYSCKNESSTESTSSKLSEEDSSMYGIQYTFTLKDSDAEAAVDAPEW